MFEKFSYKDKNSDMDKKEDEKMRGSTQDVQYLIRRNSSEKEQAEGGNYHTLN